VTRGRRKRSNGVGSLYNVDGDPDLIVAKASQRSNGRRYRRNIRRERDVTGCYTETVRQHQRRAELVLARLIVELNPPAEAEMPTSGPLRRDRVQCLYRAFDGEGRLLYVGLSLQPVVRLTGLRSTKDWFHEVRCICIEPLPGLTRHEALGVEANAIATELPLYNVMHAVPQRKR